MAKLKDIRLINIKSIKESNGRLSFLELPFKAKRIFYVTDVKSGDMRGEHAHKKCEQLLICLNGEVQVYISNKYRTQVIVLDSPTKGLYIPPMTWAEQTYTSRDSMLVVLASHSYSESDYIRDYQDYKECIA